ncbi:MAG TPA: GGDEF domain-containing protein, partial [Candidatus Sulfopaludibacter sp.]|nr:GGDEF domain-containing protein [Candidatus Sulfopaludibacter sp.]
KRIDSLEAAATIDDLTKLFNRGEMEERIRSSTSGAYSLLLIRAGGLRVAALSYTAGVAAELAAAFTKRLKNSLPQNVVIGRWGEEDFVVLFHAPKADAINSGKFVGEHLAGSYACIQDGKTVRPALQLRIGVVDSNGDKVDRVLDRVNEFLPGK